jgi:hypothetical protein
VFLVTGETFFTTTYSQPYILCCSMLRLLSIFFEGSAGRQVQCRKTSSISHTVDFQLHRRNKYNMKVILKTRLPLDYSVHSLPPLLFLVCYIPEHVCKFFYSRYFLHSVNLFGSRFSLYCFVNILIRQNALKKAGN